MLPQVTATRYVLPLREGGSLPGLVEASDDGIYVVKFHGAGQGPKVLVAEVIVAGLARLLGIRVPELVLIDLPAQIARYEADQEVQELLDASPGINLGVDYLPGSFGYEGSMPPTESEATALLWLDAYTANVDRTWSNPNLLVWHRQVWAIDHGAALYFHHSWPSRAPDPDRFVAQQFDASRHVLRGLASDVSRCHAELVERVHDSLIHVVADVPDQWLEPAVGAAEPEAVRATYVAHLQARLTDPGAWLPDQSPS